MPIVFQNLDRIEFEYHDALPNTTATFRIKGESAYKMNIAALTLYGLYRNSLYDSYSKKPDLAIDILGRPNEYPESKEPLYHYAVACSLSAMKEWKESEGTMKCYIAYQNKDRHRSKIGFVHFTEQTVNNRKVIYIAQAGVINRSHGIGRHLMKCVLAHFPASTEFYILTRVFNTEAKNLYQNILSFTPIGESEIQQLGFDNRYCGFNHTTTEEEVGAIKEKQLQSESALSSDSGYVKAVSCI